MFLPGPITNWKKTGQIFWGEGHPDHRAIWQASSEGTDESVLVPLTVGDLNHHVGGLTVLDNLLYWTDREEGGLYKIDLEESIGNANVDPVAEDFDYIRGVSAVDAGAPVGKDNISNKYIVDREVLSSGSKVFSVSQDSRGVEVVVVKSC